MNDFIMRDGHPDPGRIWQTPELGEARELTVTEQHLALLRRGIVRWRSGDWYGAPGICTRRPYGNSNVAEDIAEIAGIDLGDDHRDGGAMRPEDELTIARLHAETGIALQIALCTGELRTGRYVRGRYYAVWLPVPPEDPEERYLLAYHIVTAHDQSLGPDDVERMTLDQLRVQDPCWCPF